MWTCISALVSPAGCHAVTCSLGVRVPQLGVAAPARGVSDHPALGEGREKRFAQEESKYCVNVTLSWQVQITSSERAGTKGLSQNGWGEKGP